MSNIKNLINENGNLVVATFHNISAKRRLKNEYSNYEVVIYDKEDDVSPYEFCDRVNKLAFTVENTLIEIHCPQLIMDLLKEELQILFIYLSDSRREKRIKNLLSFGASEDKVYGENRVSQAWFEYCIKQPYSYGAKIETLSETASSFGLTLNKIPPIESWKIANWKPNKNSMGEK